MKRRLFGLLTGAMVLAMLFSLVQVSPASATPPIPFYIDWGEMPLWEADCGTFTVHSWGGVKEIGKTDVDENGKYLKSIVTVYWWVRFYRDGSDKELFTENHWSGGYKYDENNNMIIAWGHGRILVLHVPGYGPIYRDTGYMYQNYVTGERIKHGPGDLVNDEKEGICRYFAEP